MKFLHEEKLKGLTLIEVLIALAILSIALTAVIKVTTQNIKDTLYLQNKTIAAFVAIENIQAVKLGILHPPKTPDYLLQEETALGQNWLLHIYLQSTPNAHINEIHVDVFLAKQKIMQMVGYE